MNNTNPNSVSIVDTNTDTVTKEILLVGSGLVSSTVVGTKLYVSHADSQTVSVIDMTTDTLISTLSIGTSFTPASWNPISSTAVGTKLYITKFSTNELVVIDTTTDTVSTTLSV